MIRVTDALLSLRPGAEWSMTDDDFSTIVWHSENVEPLTRAEVEAEVARLEVAATAKAAARAALLERLGITEDEAALLAGAL